MRQLISQLHHFQYSLLILTMFFIQGCADLPTRFIAQDDSSKSAFDIYSDLQESSVRYNAKLVKVADETIEGMEGGVTWGAEKEGSSALITRVMGPNGEEFQKRVMKLKKSKRKEFLQDFFKNYLKNANGHRTFRAKDGQVVDLARDVISADGQNKTLDLAPFKNIDYDTAELELLDQKFSEFVEMTDDRPLNFIKPSVRMKMFNGKLPGLDGKNLFASKPLLFSNRSTPEYRSWVPHFGLAEKYISDAHGTSVGWEMNFIPQSSYGEFEEMVIWFRRELENVGQLFEAPGHHRMVFKVHPELPEGKLGELYRMIQALTVIDGIQGRTGIEKAKFKSVLNDTHFESLASGRGVIRLEDSRWAPGTRAIEFRAGTKDIRVSRFNQTVLASRLGSNEFDDLVSVNDYELIPRTNTSSSSLAQDFVSRFDVDQEVAQKAANVIRGSGLDQGYIVPLWKWESEGIPFLSPEKKGLIKGLTKDFLEQVAELNDQNLGEERLKGEISERLRGWIITSHLGQDISEYMRPRNFSWKNQEEWLSYRPSLSSQMGESSAARTLREFHTDEVDVNKIDLGIEYSGRMPLRLYADYSEEKMDDYQKAWLQTHSDLSQEERRLLIRKVAGDLAQELGIESPRIEEVEEATGHGHGLDIAYTIRDPQERKWRVEWDGVGRSYSSDGALVEGSERAGSIELVTPKFSPREEEVEAVYRTFEKNNILPQLRSGGGHINIDLGAFEGNPRALARFMTIFHENRGIISMMFQRYNRLKTAEPLDVSNSLQQKLQNFQGSEEELKELLYNEHYFNTRYGRKTRYTQLDVSAYFQDVIPEQFITEDFDIKNPQVPWRRQFRVDPNIRKAEFRLFDAPRDAFESALQIKIVRAMLHKSLNEDDELTRGVQQVDHMAYLENPDKAFEDLRKLTNELGLDYNDYRGAVSESLSDLDLISRSEFFVPMDKQLLIYPKQPGWAEATQARSSDNALRSEGRYWEPGAADELNTMTHDRYVEAARKAERMRESMIDQRSVPKPFYRTPNCFQSAGAFFE